jgi:hypothetical protein
LCGLLKTGGKPNADLKNLVKTKEKCAITAIPPVKLAKRHFLQMISFANFWGFAVWRKRD